MNLVGYAGVKTGVPYPVLARASFGVWGANLPALVRAVVACFWYGAQTARGLGRDRRAADAHRQRCMAFHKNTHVLGHSGLEVICYVVDLGAAAAHHPERHGDGAQVPGLGRARRCGSRCWSSPIGLCIKAGGFSFDHGIPQDVLLEKTKDAGVTGDARLVLAR